MRHSVRLQLDLWKVGRLRMIREVLSSYDPTGSQGATGRKFANLGIFLQLAGKFDVRWLYFKQGFGGA